MCLNRIPLYILIFFVLTNGSFSQNRIGTGEVKEIYEQYCLSCHAADLKGGLGNSLLDRSTWKMIGPDLDFIDYVLEGQVELGMPAYKGVLTRAQVRSLEVYIEEKRAMDDALPAPVANEGTYESGGYRFKLETVVEGLEIPWSVAFLPSGGLLITERDTTDLHLYQDGKLHPRVEGIPDVWNKGQGGLMEVALHPDYEQNAWIYLAYSGRSPENTEGKEVGMTKIVRGRIVDHIWTDQELIFETPTEMHSPSGAHFGTRLVFQDDYLFFGIGDRGNMNSAQDLSLPNGKIHRIFDDGRIPEDNPFAEKPDAYPTIWTLGNRNPQGLDAHPVSGELWETEHGPRGGDELNLIEPGLNYGWPVISYGMNYNGKPITDKTEAPGMEQPEWQWTPSIAVCGIDFYEGDRFPEWKNDLFVGGLASQELWRIQIENGEVASKEIILKDEGRVRDVANGPDGYLYVVLNKPDKVARLVPAE